MGVIFSFYLDPIIQLNYTHDTNHPNKPTYLLHLLETLYHKSICYIYIYIYIYIYMFKDMIQTRNWWNMSSEKMQNRASWACMFYFASHICTHFLRYVKSHTVNQHVSIALQIDCLNYNITYYLRWLVMHKPELIPDILYLIYHTMWHSLNMSNIIFYLNNLISRGKSFIIHL